MRLSLYDLPPGGYIPPKEERSMGQPLMHFEIGCRDKANRPHA
jgi:hypothetical protein